MFIKKNINMYKLNTWVYIYLFRGKVKGKILELKKIAIECENDSVFAI